MEKCKVCEWVKVVAARYKLRERKREIALHLICNSKAVEKFRMGFHNNTVLKYRNV